MSSFTTSRPVAVLMVFVAAVVFGWFSYDRLDITLMPEMSYPTITVRTEYPGAAPEEVEKDVNEPIEELLGVIGGLRRISSIGRAGVSDVVLEFAWDTTMTNALQDTLEKIDLVKLPDGAGPSLLLRYDPSLDPVMELSLTSSRSDAVPEIELRRLRRIAERQIKRTLEPIKGVAAVRIRGGLEEEIHVSLDADKLTLAGLSIRKVIEKLEQENINVAGGTVREGRADYMVRTVNEFADVDEIANTIITVIEDRDVRLRQIASITRGHKERELITRARGAETVQLDIFKEADANIVALSARIRHALGPSPSVTQNPSEGAGGRGAPGNAQHSGGLAGAIYDHEGALLEIAADRSLFIESAIDEVKQTAMLGGVLAVVVLFLFLRRIRPTLIIAVSIPVSLATTFAPLNLLGISLNIMSLGGLALGIGMLLDSSIVVLESIFRCQEEGDDLVAATVRGTREVRGAVAASIFTTIGVFLPMVFVEGVAGQAFSDLGLAVVFSLTASLVVAIFLIPTLASRRGLAGLRVEPPPPFSRLSSWTMFREDFRRSRGVRRALIPYLVFRFALAVSFEMFGRAILLGIYLVTRLGYLAFSRVIVPVAKVLAWLPVRFTQACLGASSSAYPAALRWCLGHPLYVLLMFVASVGILVYSAASLESELLPEVHQGEFTVEVGLPIGTPLEKTEAALTRIEQQIAEDPDVEKVLVTYGYDVSNSQRSDEGEHTGKFKILHRRSGDNAAVEARVARTIRAQLASVPDLDVRFVKPVLFSFRTPIEVEVYGNDLVRLREMASRVRDTLADMPVLTDVESSLRRGAPEVQVVYDRDKLRRFGLNIEQVAAQIRDEVRGREATRLRAGERRIPIVVRLDAEDRFGVDEIRRRIIDADRTGSIRLSTVADVRLGEGPSEVRRVDGNRAAIVSANLVSGAALGSAVSSIRSDLESKIDWPSDISFHVSGQSEEWERSSASLWLALALSVFLVYVIMAAQFESLVHPFIIMFTIPLAFFGSFLALWALGYHLSVVVFLGMIMLAGIVVNNAIVLIDYINQLRQRGQPLVAAVVEAGAVRLRPILLTSATTTLGLIPMALGLGDGAEIRTPLAITVISGLMVSTVLTLLVIPTLYTVTDRALSRILGREKEVEAG